MYISYWLQCDSICCCYKPEGAFYGTNLNGLNTQITFSVTEKSECKTNPTWTSPVKIAARKRATDYYRLCECVTGNTLCLPVPQTDTYPVYHPLSNTLNAPSSDPGKLATISHKGKSGLLKNDLIQGRSRGLLWWGGSIQISPFFRRWTYHQGGGTRISSNTNNPPPPPPNKKA